MSVSSRDTKSGSLRRRSLLFGLPALALKAQQAAGKGQTFASDAKRYADGATEFPVIRFTSPTYSSSLPAYYNRCMSGRNTLYFACDRTGKMEVFRGDIKSGQTKQLTVADALDPQSIAVSPGDRNLCYFDGESLRQLTISSMREREVYRLPSGVTRGRGFSLSPDGNRALFIEKSSGKHRLVALNLLRGQTSTLIESDEELSDPIPRPGASGAVLYRRGDSWWLGSNKLALAPGEALSPFWSPDGSTLFYINVSPERGQLNTIRELAIEAAGTNKLLAKTSQFVGFGANGDASVFVGASGSKASPHVLILIRSVRRELTLCEHRASDPRMVNPMFAPNSQRILFVSDLHGKPAIYTMNVERFVEETES